MSSLPTARLTSSGVTGNSNLLLEEAREYGNIERDPVGNTKAQERPKTEGGARTLRKMFQQTSPNPNHKVTSSGI